VTSIKRSDLYIIFKAAAQMCSADADIAAQEKQFLRKLAHAGNLSGEEIKKLKAEQKESTAELADQLSSATAKKTFLLTLATVAKADLELSKEELQMLESMTARLNIGRVKIREMSYEACENMVLKLLSDAFSASTGSAGLNTREKFSDLDTL